MLILLGLHLLAALAAPAVVRRAGRVGFLLLAAVPGAALVWAVVEAAGIADGAPVSETMAWVPHLDMSLDLRVDTLSWLMVVLVGGVGVAVLVYSAGYFKAGAAGLGRYAGTLVAFAGSMLGLVTTDNLLVLYVFWELTTVTSYLLIGHYSDRKSSRRAAMQAIVVTTAGGLAMLVGVVLLGQAAGTYRLSAVLADPPSGTAVTAAVALLLAGAVTKSALVPFHFWLPAAMAAPTPVSAYLHAAAMVKAGVYLVARFAPAYSGLTVWQVVVVALGGTTLLVGGYRALRQYDLKLVLAFGTVSQLGLLVLVVGLGSRATALAGIAMLGAHAMFKSALFLSVGVVDAATGTRDLRRLDGVGRALPVTAAAAALATASMIGLPPFSGYVAKEAAIEAVRHGTGWTSWLVLAAVVVGSALTVGYGLRFWWGAFAGKRVPAGTDQQGQQQQTGLRVGPVLAAEEPAASVVRRPSLLLVGPALVLAVLGLVTGLFPSVGERLLAPYADQLGGEPGHLVLWGGWAGALITLGILAAGAAAFAGRAAVERWQARLVVPFDVDRVYRRSMRRLDDLAGDVTAVTQRGSLPLYLGTVMVVMVVLVGGALVLGTGLPGADRVRLWDSPAQAVAGGLTVAAAVLAARSRRRLKAVVLTGVSGFGVAFLFMVHGAPDLGLTQVLVETATLVVFVLVLRRLPAYFSVRPMVASRWLRIVVGLAVGVTVGGLALVLPGARTADPVSVDFPEEAYEFGGGKNVVNVALVDIRAWDTMGEISVLLVAATGVASLVFLRRRSGELDRQGPTQAVWRVETDVMAPMRERARARWAAQAAAGGPSRRHSEWLAGTSTLHPLRRSVIMEIATRLLFHTMVVVAVFLLFSGHNAPGGGFAAGLLVGVALAVRYLAGGRYELADAAPVHPGLLLGSGLFLSAGVGLVALLFGQSVLESTIVEVTVPLLGHIKLVTSLFFDVGVFGVVVGLVLDVLRSLGAEVDRHSEQEQPDPGTAEPPRLDAEVAP